MKAHSFEAADVTKKNLTSLRAKNDLIGVRAEMSLTDLDKKGKVG